jgi:hypothetical protein
MTRSMYAQTLYNNYSHSSDHEIYYQDVEGESEQIYYLFDKMPRKGIQYSCIAVRMAKSFTITQRRNNRFHLLSAC